MNNEKKEQLQELLNTTTGKMVAGQLIELGWTPPQETQPEQWEPGKQLCSIGVDEAYTNGAEYVKVMAYLNFHFNVYQLIQDLNGDWKWGEGKAECYRLIWDYSNSVWFFHEVHAISYDIGPFKDIKTAIKARGIMSTQSWAKNGPPII